MKPSERIEEWRVFFQKNRPSETALENTLSAIITYLDEQYEQQKPCEHKHFVGVGDEITETAKPV